MTFIELYMMNNKLMIMLLTVVDNFITFSFTYMNLNIDATFQNDLIGDLSCVT